MDSSSISWGYITIYLYDDSTGLTTTYGPYQVNPMVPGDGDFYIGKFPDAWSTTLGVDGNIDEVFACARLLSAIEADQIRQGIFGH